MDYQDLVETLQPRVKRAAFFSTGTILYVVTVILILGFINRRKQLEIFECTLVALFLIFYIIVQALLLYSISKEKVWPAILWLLVETTWILMWFVSQIKIYTEIVWDNSWITFCVSSLILMSFSGYNFFMVFIYTLELARTRDDSYEEIQCERNAA